jgi:hypothetical protein
MINPLSYKFVISDSFRLQTEAFSGIQCHKFSLSRFLLVSLQVQEAPEIPSLAL